MFFDVLHVLRIFKVATNGWNGGEHGGAANVRVAQDHHHDGQGIQSDPPTRQVVDVTQDDGARKAG